jgi:hypothetical protein
LYDYEFATNPVLLFVDRAGEPQRFACRSEIAVQITHRDHALGGWETERLLRSLGRRAQRRA